MTHPPSTWLIRLQRVVAAIVLIPVHLYRVLLSPLKGGPSCRFLPTCSEYAVQAVKQRGVVVGSGLAVWRIARCHPFCRGGFDPVPVKMHHVQRELG